MNPFLVEETNWKLRQFSFDSAVKKPLIRFIRKELIDLGSFYIYLYTCLKTRLGLMIFPRLPCLKICMYRGLFDGNPSDVMSATSSGSYNSV